jgi:hypothetical protein
MECEMFTHQLNQLDTLTNVQHFLDVHDDVVGPLKDTEGRKLLDAVVAQLFAQENEQFTADGVLRGALARQRSLVAELKQQHMKPIAKFARAKLRGTPDFTALARSGSNLKGSKLVGAARAMATAAASVSDVLTAAQFPADAVKQLGAAADAVANAIVDRAASKQARGAATASIRQHLSLGREAVAMLDPIVTKRLAGNKGLLEGWRQAKRVVKKPGVVKTPAIPPAPITPSQPAVQSASEPSTSGPAEGSKAA